MKILKILILLLILAGISLVGDIINEKNADAKNLKIINTSLPVVPPLNEKVRANYKIDVEYIEASHILTVDETINWKNIDPIQVDTLFLNLPASSKEQRGDYAQLTYLISSIQINGVKADFEIVSFDNRNFIDSSLISVRIPNGLQMNESLVITTQYNIILPKESKWSDAQFYDFENWYVTVSPFIDGKFNSFSTHNYIETFLLYSDFDVTIQCSEDYSVALPGDLISKNNNGINFHTVSAKNIPRFNWLLFNRLTKNSKEININSREITLDIFIQNGKDNYIERYVEGATKYLESLSSFGNYPFNKLTIVDIPNFGHIKNKSYPNIIALNTDLISPTKTQKFEYQLALVIAEQYFGNLINSNNLEEAWLSKGLSSYVAEKLVRKYFIYIQIIE